MNEFLAVLLVLLVCAFLFFQIRGMIRDFKKRKKLKAESESKIEKKEADLKEDAQHEQDGDTKDSR